MSKHTDGYEISRDGKIFSCGNWRGYGKREITQDLNASGYPSVRLTVRGKRTRYAVHVLVAEKYLPPKPGPDYQVRHLDGNKNNSHAENLAWGTAKQNADDRMLHGKTSKGESHGAAIRASSHAFAVRAFRQKQKDVAVIEQSEGNK